MLQRTTSWNEFISRKLVSTKTPKQVIKLTFDSKHERQVKTGQDTDFKIPNVTQSIMSEAEEMPLGFNQAPPMARQMPNKDGGQDNEMFDAYLTDFFSRYQEKEKVPPRRQLEGNETACATPATVSPQPHDTVTDPTPRLFVGGVPSRITNRDFEDYFAQFGPVREVVVRRGFGFVSFQEAAGTAACMAVEESL